MVIQGSRAFARCRHPRLAEIAAPCEEILRADITQPAGVETLYSCNFDPVVAAAETDQDRCPINLRALASGDGVVLWIDSTTGHDSRSAAVDLTGDGFADLLLWDQQADCSDVRLRVVVGGEQRPAAAFDDQAQTCGEEEGDPQESGFAFICGTVSNCEIEKFVVDVRQRRQVIGRWVWNPTTRRFDPPTRRPNSRRR